MNQSLNGKYALNTRVALSVSTSRSRDGLETHLWSRLVSSRIFLAMSRSRLGLGNLGLESRLGLVAYRLGLWTSRLGLVEWKVRPPKTMLTLFKRSPHSYSYFLVKEPRVTGIVYSLCSHYWNWHALFFTFANSVSAYYCIDTHAKPVRF